MSDNEIKSNENNRKKKILGGLLLGAIPLLFILYLVLGPLFHVLFKDLSAHEMYVISAWVNVRATPDIKALKMGKADYGTKLLMYETVDDWAEVLFQGQKGYVSKKFIADPETYYMLDGLFGDGKASQLVKGAKNRLALVRYLISKGYMSDIPDEVQKELYGDSDKKEMYQLFTEPTGSRYNSAVYADFNGDYRNDAAFVLKNSKTGKTRLVVITFDKNDPMNLSKAIYDEELENSWNYIRVAPKGYRYYAEEDSKKSKIAVSGLLIGSNRNRNLNDPTYLLIYNGEGFDMVEQKK